MGNGPVGINLDLWNVLRYRGRSKNGHLSENCVSAPIDVSARPVGSVSDAGRYQLNLTGSHSHVLNNEAGRGNLIIGPASMGKKADLHVVPDAAINWSAFTPFSTPAGSPWPRYISYYGNDSDFFDWAVQRRIESFVWAPAFAERRSINASASQISMLQIRLGDVSGHLNLMLPKDGQLELVGDLSRFTAAGNLPHSLSLAPALSRRQSDAPYTLPELGLLHGVPSLSLNSKPLGQSISLRAIEHFSQLDSLALHGNFTDWAALAKLPRLKRLEIRFAPDLTGLPSLDVWPELDMLIAYNVDEAAGKRLKAQMKAREKVRAWNDYASVSKLRNAQWWHSAYGRPFAGWSSRMAKAANTAYDVALGALENAENAQTAKAVITDFANHFNTMKGIETAQREDLGEAVWQFSQLAHIARLGVTADQAQQWFDEARDY
ncbi:hypothetical protein D3C81_1173370 [compost metagenome]